MPDIIVPSTSPDSFRKVVCVIEQHSSSSETQSHTNSQQNFRAKFKFWDGDWFGFVPDDAVGVEGVVVENSGKDGIRNNWSKPWGLTA